MLCYTHAMQLDLGSPAGTPEPLGPSLGPSQKGINFALYSEHASAVALEIYTEEDHSVHEIMLDPTQHKSGHVWHVLVDTLPPAGVLYAYKVQGQGGWETGGRSGSITGSLMMQQPYCTLSLCMSHHRRTSAIAALQKDTSYCCILAVAMAHTGARFL